MSSNGTSTKEAARSGEPVARRNRGALSRRRFFKRAGVGAAVAAGCSSGGDDSADHVRVASLAELEAGPVEFDLPGAGRCFAAKLEQPVGAAEEDPSVSIVAFSSLCPHMGCPIGLDAVDVQRGRFGPCSCHQSLFDIRRNGQMVRGRASCNLAEVELRVEGDDVYAVGIEGLAFGVALSSETALTTPLDVTDTQDRSGA